ncbi:MAG: sulfotransferase [Pseudomonadota bacterium]
MQSCNNPPIFVVGAPRSGTTMLAAMLASHPAIAAGPETQFFSKLPTKKLEGACQDAVWPNAAVQLLMSLTLADQKVGTLFATDETQLTNFLAARKPSISAILEALTVPFSEAHGKKRWAEKTPNHIQHLGTIRRLWPDAKIIRIIRDPRDVGLSTRKIPTFSDQILPNIYVWQEWNGRAERFLAADPGSMTVRYEDIVDDPEDQLRRICDHIGEDFDPAMTRFEQSAQSVSSANEIWKGQVSDGMTASRKYAWKSDLPDTIRPVCDLVCHELLIAHGYEHGPPPRKTRTAFRLSRAYLEKQEDALIRDAAKGVRWLPVDDPEKADRVVDHPQYSQFRNPVMVLRLMLGKAQSWMEL